MFTQKERDVVVSKLAPIVPPTIGPNGISTFNSCREFINELLTKDKNLSEVEQALLRRYEQSLKEIALISGQLNYAYLDQLEKLQKKVKVKKIRS